MRKFIPLIEAFGLIFALVSWWFSWASVQQWNDRINSFVESIEIHQRLYEGRHLSSLIEYEASVSRASRNFKLTGATTKFDYEYAWQFAIVRAKSAKIRENTISYINNVISLIENTTQKYQFKTSKQLRSTKSKLVKLTDYIDKNSSKEIFGKDHPSIFSASEISAVDAINFHSELQNLDKDLINSGTELISLMKHRKKRARTWYMVFFVFGSILAVSGKIMNYNIESEKNNY